MRTLQSDWPWPDYQGEEIILSKLWLFWSTAESFSCFSVAQHTHTRTHATVRQRQEDHVSDFKAFCLLAQISVARGKSAVVMHENKFRQTFSCLFTFKDDLAAKERNRANELSRAALEKLSACEFQVRFLTVRVREWRHEVTRRGPRDRCSLPQVSAKWNDELPRVFTTFSASPRVLGARWRNITSASHSSQIRFEVCAPARTEARNRATGSSGRLFLPLVSVETQLRSPTDFQQ